MYFSNKHRDKCEERDDKLLNYHPFTTKKVFIGNQF